MKIAAVLFSVVVLFSERSLGASGTQGPLNSHFQFNDSHFHLTNYVQEGPDVHDFLKIMGNRVERSTLFGIPLQQQWSYRVSGDTAPTYYLQSDAPLYYYSFTDAMIAMAYKSLTESEQKRFDPMITGFNPTDMYAVDHIRRVLRMFPGVFSGIGEFTIHKEFVSSKIAGVTPSLTDPALDRILDFAAEAGLVVLIHNDMDTPFPNRVSKAAYVDQMVHNEVNGSLPDQDAPPEYLAQVTDLFARHPKTTIIWAHVGLGRVVRPVKNYVVLIESLLKDPRFRNVDFDISWSETAKYITATPESLRRTADLINRYPDRFLFGTDTVGPRSADSYYEIFNQYAPLWKRLSPEASEKIRLTNYRRLFDKARHDVRAWEKANVPEQGQDLNLARARHRKAG